MAPIIEMRVYNEKHMQSVTVWGFDFKHGVHVLILLQLYYYILKKVFIFFPFTRSLSIFLQSRVDYNETVRDKQWQVQAAWRQMLNIKPYSPSLTDRRNWNSKVSAMESNDYLDLRFSS